MTLNWVPGSPVDEISLREMTALLHSLPIEMFFFLRQMCKTLIRFYNSSFLRLNTSLEDLIFETFFLNKNNNEK